MSKPYMTAYNIVWETDGKDVSLPETVDLPVGFMLEHETSVVDYLSDTYGWLVVSHSLNLNI